MAATPDTPQERDDKAAKVEQDRIDFAEAVAKQLNRFKWEVRGYCAIGLLYIISQIFS